MPLRRLQVARPRRWREILPSGRPSQAVAYVHLDFRDLYGAVVSDQRLHAVAGQLYADGHYARAVEEAFKLLNGEVRRRSRVLDKDGADLMFHVFDPDKPVLRLNRLRSTSDKDEQAGIRQIMAGAMKGIRNPRAHEHEQQDSAQSALEMLTIANHLLRRLDRCTRSRSR